MTENTTSPGFRYVRPSLRGITLHCGGKMEETRTKFCEAIPASLRANSNDVNRSLCFPTPLVKKIFFGTMLFPNFYVSSVSLNILHCVQGSRMSLSHPGGWAPNFWSIHRRFTRLSGFEQRVYPSQSRKTGEVAICRVKHSAVLNRESGQFRIC